MGAPACGFHEVMVRFGGRMTGPADEDEDEDEDEGAGEEAATSAWGPSARSPAQSSQPGPA